VITERLAFGLAIGKSRIHGKGCFAAIPFHQNQRIAENVGERVSLAEAERRRCAAGEQCIRDVDSNWAIDGSRGGNGTQYLNHSCQPNSYVIVFEKRIFIYALREIAPGEEITTDYLYELYSDQTTCLCRTVSCDEITSLAGLTAASAEANQTPHQHSGQLTLECP
jgi:SET domain-containing protein